MAASRNSRGWLFWMPGDNGASGMANPQMARQRVGSVIDCVVCLAMELASAATVADGCLFGSGKSNMAIRNVIKPPQGLCRASGTAFELKRDLTKTKELNLFLPINTIRVVRPLKSFLVLLVLGMWFSCTVHCTMEMTALACCSGTKLGNNSNQTPASPEHCVCDWIKSGGYGFQKCAPLATAPQATLFLFVVSSDGEASQISPSLPTPNSSPPKFPVNWQFVFRTASSPRAPSFIS